jgi:hypothetical protein
MAALAAAALLTVTAAGSAAFAYGGPKGDPSASPRPRPTAKVQPVRVGPKIDCAKILAASAPSATPTAVPSATGKSSQRDRIGRDWQEVARQNLIRWCLAQKDKEPAGSQANGLLRRLQALGKAVAASGLNDAEKAKLKAEIDAAIAALTAAQGDQAAQAQSVAAGKLARGVNLHVVTILGSLRVLVAADRLDARAAALQSQIDAAPSGVDTAAAQKYLDAMKARVAAARALAAPLKDQLMALTMEQIAAGRADPVLGAAARSLFKANLAIWMASLEGRIVTWILAGKPGFQGKLPKPSVAPSVTPVPTPVPTV